jgi:hypothetical protein
MTVLWVMPGMVVGSGVGSWVGVCACAPRPNTLAPITLAAPPTLRPRKPRLLKSCSNRECIVFAPQKLDVFCKLSVSLVYAKNNVKLSEIEPLKNAAE